MTGRCWGLEVGLEVSRARPHRRSLATAGLPNPASIDPASRDPGAPVAHVRWRTSAGLRRPTAIRAWRKLAGMPCMPAHRARAPMRCRSAPDRWEFASWTLQAARREILERRPLCRRRPPDAAMAVNRVIKLSPATRARSGTPQRRASPPPRAPRPRCSTVTRTGHCTALRARRSAARFGLDPASASCAAPGRMNLLIHADQQSYGRPGR